MALHYSSLSPLQRPALWIVALTASPLVSGAESVEVQNQKAVASTEHKATRSLRVRKFSPDFYGAFAEAESTYDADADGARVGGLAHLQDGWEPNMKSASNVRGAVKPEWFDESASGGPEVAWQTHYPAAQASGTWTKDAAGDWHELYNQQDAIAQPHRSWFNILKHSAQLGGSWFDSAVAQIDGFGRPKRPSRASGANFVDWEERSVNTTVKCSDAGCAAAAMLQAFDPSREQATHCVLSAHVMPTGFMPSVEYIQVSGKDVSTNCMTANQGCHDNARSLSPCIQSLDLETLMTESGALRIDAKLGNSTLGNASCPYEGNALYVVPMVTCLVKQGAAKNRSALPLPNATAQ